MQLDRAEKGFSFMRDGALDMRMDIREPLTAAVIVNTWSEEELGKLFETLGEEYRWRKAAASICMARKKKEISTTKELADILDKSIGRTGKTHAATRVFQALRIRVNDELGAIERMLEGSIERLNVGGVIGAITFHSLEDRLVKEAFRDRAFVSSIDKKQGVIGELSLLTKKPIVPTYEEIRKNPRSRSSKMRFAQKLKREER